MNQINIFYADDDDDDLMIFNDAVTSIFEKNQKQYTISLHKNGDDLLENILNYKSNNSIVFLDLLMPRKSGFHLLEEIRKVTQINKIPVIIYSTSSDERDIKMSYNLGANFYLFKPNNFNDLILNIKKIIQTNWKNHQTDVEHFVFNKPLY